jgi:hypothetical protein
MSRRVSDLDDGTKLQVGGALSNDPPAGIMANKRVSGFGSGRSSKVTPKSDINTSLNGNGRATDHQRL